MRLIELRLQNFRQHADTTIRFRSGLTGIIGSNGAGKSTLLEAIAWSIYGSEAARGTNDTLRFSRAPSRARVQVDLHFGLGRHEYRVKRTLSSAEVYLDGGDAPVATTVGGVSRFLESRLGMSRREFFNTYFTGQKELQFLATMGPTERGRFLSTVLGFERLRLAQDAARSRRSELRHEVDALRGGMADPEKIRGERHGAEARLRDARTALAAAEGEYAIARVSLATLTPRWLEAQGVRERQRELASAVAIAASERETAAREVARIEAELQSVAVAEGEAISLKERLRPLDGVRQECERLSQLARTHERRRALVEQLGSLRTELDRTSERLARVEQAPSLLTRFVAELSGLREERRVLEQQREERNGKWLEDRQDARTKLVGYRDLGGELREQVSQVRDAGPAGICPTCQRPLGKDFERLLGELEDQLALSIQDEKWWAAREKQLAERPDDLVELEQRLEELERAVEDRARKHTRCEAAVTELEGLQRERDQRRSRLSSITHELDSLPDGYDAAAHREADERLQSLRDLETRAARLEEVISRRDELETQLARAIAGEKAAGEQGRAAALEIESLGMSDQAFATLRVEVETANDRLHRAELRSTELRGRLETAEQSWSTAVRAEEEQDERARHIAVREVELAHHNELDAALTRLRADLNTQVRPELGEIASIFLNQLTDGRYSALEIDESYNLLVLEEGVEKPVISGGEEDIANLVLRLSLSQMIAERAGHPLSLLILDEVFGSLDAVRRDNVTQLLRRLGDRFEQVILITHIEGIRDDLDQVIRVSFDERTGSALTREETLADAAPPANGIAAD
jgi:DNA repair protein SbcC/Rad50